MEESHDVFVEVRLSRDSAGVDFTYGEEERVVWRRRRVQRENTAG